jgi:hypothetical protein
LPVARESLEQEAHLTELILRVDAHHHVDDA